MKKITTISFLLFVFILSASAQNEKFFRFGLHGSPSVAWLKPETKSYQSKGLRLGFGYGLIAEFTLADNYSFATGVESVYSGGKLQNVDTFGITTTATYRVQYVEVPIALKMKTNEINYITYYAKFGGGLNLRLNSFADFSYKDAMGNSMPSLLDEDIKSDINLFRISFLIGLGIEYSLGGTTSALIGVNFNNGLTDIFKDDNIKGKNNFITVNLGVIF
jgi:hypothetical protein